jgi:hypothetical protein
MSGDAAEIRRLAAALIASEAAELPSNAVDLAIAEGVAPLLAASAAADTLDAASRARLRVHAHGAAIHAAALDDELRRLLPLLADGGGAPVVIKGAHLAHTVYAAPHLRPRADSDLLIAPAARQAVTGALRRAGYTPSALTSGSLILGQFLYEKALGPGLVHYVDVHWRAASPLVFAEAFDATAIAAAGVPIAALGPSARGPAPQDALALACVHVVAHHWRAASLRWLNDLRLLAQALDAPSRQRFAEAAGAGRYREVASCALQRAHGVFGTPSLQEAIVALSTLPAREEPSAALTRIDRRPVDDFLLDLRTAGWRRGATLVREHLLPPPAYMRAAFAGRPLPIAYAARLVRAVRKRL